MSLEVRETVPSQSALVTPSRCGGKSELYSPCDQVWLLLSSSAVLESCGLMAHGK